MKLNLSGSRTKVAVRGVLITVGLLVAGMTATCLRLSIEGKRAMAQSDVEFNRGQLRESLLHARRAASLYFPGLRHVNRADARLDAIALGAESAHHRDLAIRAWQSIRTTERQRQWVHGQATKRAQQANERLSTLLLNDVGGDMAPEQLLRSRRTIAAWQAPPEGSSPVLVAARLIALAAVLGGFLVIYASMGRWGGSRRVTAISGAALLALGAIAWAVSLSLT